MKSPDPILPLDKLWPLHRIKMALNESTHTINHETDYERLDSIIKKLDKNTQALDSNTELLRPGSKIMKDLGESEGKIVNFGKKTPSLETSDRIIYISSHRAEATPVTGRSWDPGSYRTNLSRIPST